MVMLKDNSLNTLCRFKLCDTNEWIYISLFEFIIKQSIDLERYNYDVDTFCLCVGINDKGQIIFEKDIIRTDDAEWGYGGEYDENHDSYRYYIVPTIRHFTHVKINAPFEYGSYLKYGDEYIIIGNVFDNPELLSKITPNFYQLDDDVA